MPTFALWGLTEIGLAPCGCLPLERWIFCFGIGRCVCGTTSPGSTLATAQNTAAAMLPTAALGNPGKAILAKTPAN